jgi:hypothetical protein
MFDTCFHLIIFTVAGGYGALLGVAANASPSLARRSIVAARFWLQL